MSFLKEIGFDHREDQRFFVDLLCDENAALSKYAFLFDFRPASTKRREFQRMRKLLLSQLLQRHGRICQLRLVPHCDIGKGVQIDHIVPLATNKLNKRRAVAAKKGRKVPAQSLGSNDPRNLVLACPACNGNKKHRFLERAQVRRLLAAHGA